MSERLTAAQQQDREQYIANAPLVARSLLAAHVNAPDSSMVLLPHDLAKHPAQDPMCFVVDTDPRPLEVANQYARMADRRFDAMVEMAAQSQEAEEIIDAAGQILDAGNNIWVATAHVDDINDMAYAGKISTNLLHERNHKPKNTIAIISKAIPEAAYLMDIEGSAEPLEVPLMMVLQTGFTRIVLTWPKTVSSEDGLSKLPEAEVNRHNREQGAIGAIDETLSQGKALGAIAPTGRTRLVNGEMTPISDATIGLMARPDTYVWPMIVWRQSDVPVVRFCGEPVQIDPEHPEQADDLMSLITADMNTRIPGKNFAYTAPIRRKIGRSALES